MVGNSLPSTGARSMEHNHQLVLLHLMSQVSKLPAKGITTRVTIGLIRGSHLTGHPKVNKRINSSSSSSSSSSR